MFRRFLPSADAIRHSRLLRWLGPRIHDPHLWRLNRRAVARGVAIGAFFGLLVPIAQIPVAAAFAFAFRANLWASAAATLVTNPFTFAPLYYVAYLLGAALIGAPVAAAPEVASMEAPSFWNWLAGWGTRLLSLGPPLILGLTLLAVVLSVTAYFATHYVWRARVLAKRRKGRRKTPRGA